MIKKIMAGMILVATLTMTVYGIGQYDSGRISAYDFADIYVNGHIGLEKGLGYTRASDGQTLPSTLNWDGTTYVPLRSISELLGAEVGWNGSILIDLEQSSEGPSHEVNSGFTKTTFKTVDLDYCPKLTFDVEGAKLAYVEDAQGHLIENLDIQVSGGQVLINNAYLLALESHFSLTVLKEDAIVVQPFNLGGLTLNSFVMHYGQWYSIVPANEAKGFSYPVAIGFSNHTSDIRDDFDKLKPTLIVEGSNEGVTVTNSESFEKQINTRLSGEISTAIADRNDLPFMISMFPRPQQDGLLYTHALDRDTLFNTSAYFEGLNRGNLYRIDQQFIAMIDYCQEIFRSLGLEVEDKVAIAGFSASSDWATRMTMLYPERMKCVLANLPSTMPMTSYEGHDLPYPLGMSDVDILGIDFDFEAYKQVPQFWFVGGDDDGDGTRYDDGWGNYGDYKNAWNQEGIDYRRIFGEDSMKRRVTQMTIFADLGMDQIDYISYPGLAHGWGDQQLADIDRFLREMQ